MGNDCNRRGTRFARLLYLVILCMLLSPAGVFAQTKRINLELKNVTVQEAIATLNRTENYSIIVSSDEVDLTKRISVSAKNATIREVLDQVFAGQEVTCTIDGHRISVTKKQPSAASKPAAAPELRARTGDRHQRTADHRRDGGRHGHPERYADGCGRRFRTDGHEIPR